MNQQDIQNTIDSLKADRDVILTKLGNVTDAILTQTAKRDAFEARLNVLDRTISSMEELKTVVN
jgi:hypothetical protein